MPGTATLFDADAASYRGTIEVLGVIFKAEDDGYAVLEVRDAEAPARTSRWSGRSPTSTPATEPKSAASGRPTAHGAPAAGEWRAATRPGRPRGPARLPDHAAPHRQGARRAAGRRPRRRRPRGDRRRPHRTFAALAAWAATRPRRRPNPGTPAAPSATSTSSSRPTASPTWRPDPCPLRRARDAVLHEDPYWLTEIDGVGFARADKIALAADVPPESDRRAQAAAVYAIQRGRARRATRTCRSPS